VGHKKSRRGVVFCGEKKKGDEENHLLRSGHSTSASKELQERKKGEKGKYSYEGKGKEGRNFPDLRGCRLVSHTFAPGPAKMKRSSKLRSERGRKEV